MTTIDQTDRLGRGRVEEGLRKAPTVLEPLNFADLPMNRYHIDLVLLWWLDLLSGAQCHNYDCRRAGEPEHWRSCTRARTRERFAKPPMAGKPTRSTQKADVVFDI